MKVASMEDNPEIQPKKRKKNYTKNKGGRPPSAGEERRTKRISINVTEDEFKNLDERCGDLNQQPAVLARIALKNSGLLDPFKDGETVVYELIKQLRAGKPNNESRSEPESR